MVRDCPRSSCFRAGSDQQLDRQPQASTAGWFCARHRLSKCLDRSRYFLRTGPWNSSKSRLTNKTGRSHRCSKWASYFPVNAYDGAKRFFETLGWNYIVFAYDWRQPIAVAADFLAEFLADLSAEVKARKNVDPLPTTTLLAHSQGRACGKGFSSAHVHQSQRNGRQSCVSLPAVRHRWHSVLRHFQSPG